MTVWFKEDWNAYEAGQVANLPDFVEAELVAAGKAIDQAKVRPFETDEFGNVIANVNHRTGTLAALLGIVGGAGEIALATDKRAIVRYLADGSPEVFGGDHGGALNAYIGRRSSDLSVPTATLTTLTLTSIDAGTASEVDIATGVITCPDQTTAHYEIYHEVAASVFFAQGATGTLFASLETDPTGFGIWSTIDAKEITAFSGAATGFALSARVKQGGGGFSIKYRLRVRHAHGSNIGVSSSYFGVRVVTANK